MIVIVAINVVQLCSVVTLVVLPDSAVSRGQEEGYTMMDCSSYGVAR